MYYVETIKKVKEIMIEDFYAYAKPIYWNIILLKLIDLLYRLYLEFKLRSVLFWSHYVPGNQIQRNM